MFSINFRRQINAADKSQRATNCAVWSTVKSLPFRRARQRRYPKTMSAENRPFQSREPHRSVFIERHSLNSFRKKDNSTCPKAQPTKIRLNFLNSIAAASRCGPCLWRTRRLRIHPRILPIALCANRRRDDRRRGFLCAVGFAENATSRNGEDRKVRLPR